MLEASRRLGVARGTVQARLDKLVAAGVITGWGPELVPGGAGLPGDGVPHPGDPAGRAATTRSPRHLAAIPEVLEAHTITGAGDMWCRVVARSNTDLQRVIDLVLADPGDRPLLHGDRARHPGPLPGPAAGAGRAVSPQLSRAATSAAAAATMRRDPLGVEVRRA